MKNIIYHKKSVLSVSHKREIVVQGNYKELTNRKGAYYELVKNQLELGN